MNCKIHKIKEWTLNFLSFFILQTVGGDVSDFTLSAHSTLPLSTDQTETPPKIKPFQPLAERSDKTTRVTGVDSTSPHSPPPSCLPLSARSMERYTVYPYLRVLDPLLNCRRITTHLDRFRKMWRFGVLFSLVRVTGWIKIFSVLRGFNVHYTVF